MTISGVSVFLNGNDVAIWSFGKGFCVCHYTIVIDRYSFFERYFVDIVFF